MSEELLAFVAWLDGFLGSGRPVAKDTAYLENTAWLCARLGHPESFCPCVHVAGSKGKGSISAMIAAILAASGRRVGVLGSPHVVDFRERARNAQGFFADEVYVAAARELRECVENIDPSEIPGGRSWQWSQLVTVWGMLVFRQARVEVAVYEVGLGGRLDSTNVIVPRVSVIGLIEREHTQILGNTLEEIAAEKSGIIKENVPVVVATQSLEVLDVFRRVARGRRAPLQVVDEQLTARVLSMDRAGMTIALASERWGEPVVARLRLLGEHQAENASLAALAVLTAWPELETRAIAQGLAAAFVPGRFEIITDVKGYSSLPALVLDGAHTPRSLERTLATFRSVFPGDAQLLFACATDKDAPALAALIGDYFTRVTLTQRPGEPGRTDVASLAEIFAQAGVAAVTIAEPAVAITQAVSQAARSQVPLLVTGSFYLLGEVKTRLHLVERDQATAG